MVILGSFWKPEASGQTVLPDGTLLIGKIWKKMPKFKNSNATFWVIFKHCAHRQKVQRSMAGKNGFKHRISNTFWGQKLRNFRFYFCFSQVLDIMNSMKTFFLDPECFWEKKKDRNCNKFLDSSWQVGKKTLLKALKASLMTFANSNLKSSSKISQFEVFRFDISQCVQFVIVL